MPSDAALEKTMLIPLWGRAQASRLCPEIMVDEQAIAITTTLSYNFTPIADTFNEFGAISHLVRALCTENAVRQYLQKHPKATVVNIGAGLDTGFSRLDNGRIHWYNLDLPNALAFRRQVLPPMPRMVDIACSMLNYSWLQQINFNPDNGIILIAAGVFYFFHENEIQGLLQTVAQAFPGGQLVFDANSSAMLALNNQKMQQSGNQGAKMYYAIDNPAVLAGYSPHIQVQIVQPRFAGIPRLPQMSSQTVQKMDACDASNSILHIQLGFV